jgi:hypothetical protein
MLLVILLLLVFSRPSITFSSSFDILEDTDDLFATTSSSSSSSSNGGSSSALGELSPNLFLSSKTPYYSGALGAAEPVPSQCKLVHINHLGKSHIQFFFFLIFSHRRTYS